MGFYITKLRDTKLQEYIGSQTMYSCVDNGAFSAEVDEELADYANATEGVCAVLDKNGIENFLSVLKSGRCHGRDVSKFIKIVEEKYLDGFMMCR